MEVVLSESMLYSGHDSTGISLDMYIFHSSYSYKIRLEIRGNKNHISQQCTSISHPFAYIKLISL